MPEQQHGREKPFAGRTEELALTTAALQRAAGSEPRTVVVTTWPTPPP